MNAPIIENWSDVTITLEGLRRTSDVKDYALAEGTVDAAHPVGNFPNLLSQKVGERVSVYLPAAQAAALVPGGRAEVRMRQAGPSLYFAHPTEPLRALDS